MKSLSIIIPVYNEQHNIKELISEIQKCLDNLFLYIIIICCKFIKIYVFNNIFLKIIYLKFKNPGNDLLFHALRQSTIGANSFHGRVRDGIGC